MDDTIDYEVYEILHLSDWELDTLLFVVVSGFIDDKTFNVDFEIRLTNDLNTYNEISDYLYDFIEYCYIKVEDTEIEDLIKANWLMNVEGV